MKTMTQRFDSCLVWYAGVFGSLLLIFVISYIVDTIRLANTWNEAYTLAAKLGYTPLPRMPSPPLLSPEGRPGYSCTIIMPSGRSSGVHPIVVILTGRFANSAGMGGGGGGCQPQPVSSKAKLTNDATH